MFFKKSRMERDIDGFKAMQERGSLLAKRDSSEDEQGGGTSTAGAGDSALRLNEQQTGEASTAPIESADGRQQSLVGANATWRGKLRTDGSARILGELSGEVEAGETVFIEKGAKVRANVQARKVIIGGDLEGQIVCREQLVVQNSGRLGGEVKTKSLVIEEGAIVQSEIKMLRDSEPLRPAVKAPTNIASITTSLTPASAEAAKS